MKTDLARAGILMSMIWAGGLCAPAAGATQTTTRPVPNPAPDSSAAPSAAGAAVLADVGWRYLKGNGVDRDYTLAIQSFRKAAERGNARAEMGLGLVYREGDGVARDYVESAKWYRRSAQHGCVDAQSFLGQLFVLGQGVPPDGAEAVRWLGLAAAQGHVPSEIWLGYIYQSGTGVPKDEAQAVKWFRAAAESGSAEGQYFLGHAYATGTGVDRDDAEAARWLEKSAAQGYAKARDELGKMTPPPRTEEVARAPDPNGPKPAPDPIGAKPTATDPAASADPAPAPTTRASGSSDDLRELIGVKTTGKRRVDVPNIPPMSLRGFVQPHGLPRMALLEIADLHRVFLVKVGTQIPVTVTGRVTPSGRGELSGLDDPSKPSGAARGDDHAQSQIILEVTQITSEGVTVKAGQLSQTIVIR